MHFSNSRELQFKFESYESMAGHSQEKVSSKQITSLYRMVHIFGEKPQSMEYKQIY